MEMQTLGEVFKGFFVTNRPRFSKLLVLSEFHWFSVVNCPCHRNVGGGGGGGGQVAGIPFYISLVRKSCQNFHFSLI